MAQAGPAFKPPTSPLDRGLDLTLLVEFLAADHDFVGCGRERDYYPRPSSLPLYKPDYVLELPPGGALWRGLLYSTFAPPG